MGCLQSRFERVCRDEVWLRWLGSVVHRVVLGATTTSTTTHTHTHTFLNPDPDPTPLAPTPPSPTLRCLPHPTPALPNPLLSLKIQ
eukprot:365028-Chlamydomonas_euryale.AAC.55